MMPDTRERVLNIIKNKTERAENLVWAKIRAVATVLAFFVHGLHGLARIDFCYCSRIARINTNSKLSSL